MSDNNDNAGAHVLYWRDRLFSAEDLRRHWNNQRELVVSPRTLLTPLAVDELRAKGVHIRRQPTAANTGDQVAASAVGPWTYAQERPDSAVIAAVTALEREGITWSPQNLGSDFVAAWLQSVRESARKGAGCVLFCLNAALMCCLANKVAGLRAATVANALQAGRAFATLGANVLVVQMPGRTFFEIRQILRTAATAPTPDCPTDVAKLVLELENHAHR
jgi:hypothetical protein